ncbi:MAG TPA: hydrolase [Bacteroidota bacterium]|nr:hydrolase [Bacteroidota bacterium]
MIDKQTTALVVIDLQKGIVGAPALPNASADVVAHAASLARAFRKFQMPVFLVHVTPSLDRKDALHPICDRTMPVNAQPAPDWAELVPELEAAPGDFIITKRQWGAFYGTELDLQLRRRSIKTIVLCGISTNIGVESTARFAYEYGYQQIFVEDACSARSKEEHDHTMKYNLPRMGRVLSTKDVLAELE